MMILDKQYSYRFCLFLLLSVVAHALLLVLNINDDTYSSTRQSSEIVLKLTGDHTVSVADIISNKTSDGGNPQEPEIASSSSQVLGDNLAHDKHGKITQDIQKTSNEQGAQDKKFFLMAKISPITLQYTRQQDLHNLTAEEQHAGSEVGSQDAISGLLSNVEKRANLIKQFNNTKFVDDFATMTAVEAQYLQNLIAIIEKIGNQYYPQEAISSNIIGFVRVAFTISEDGKLVNYEILESGGSILDAGVSVILKKSSAEFTKFDPAMMSEYDKLEIVRTWKFSKGFVID